MFDDNPNFDQESDDFSGPATSQPGTALAADPEYQQLLTLFQKAEWQLCSQLVASLRQRYPNESSLEHFAEELDIKLMFQNKESAGRKQKTRRTWLNILILGLVVAVGIVAGLYITRWITSTEKPAVVTAAESASQADQIKSLEDQALKLLQLGNTQLALDAIQKIRAIDPAYPGLAGLQESADRMAELDALYGSAAQALNAGDDMRALTLFKQVEAVNPQYRDVRNQISQIERRNSVGDLLTAGDAAYREERWDDVISAYEEVLAIDPQVESPELEEQLFLSYYNKIHSILTKENATIEEINSADSYYRRAVSLVPQNKAFAQERRDLQQFLVGLLVIKYRQTAKMIIESPTTTEEQLSSAVIYLNKAANLSSSDTRISAELERAQTYLLALQKFNRMEWDAAITYLEKLSRFQSGYAGGMVEELLYEAYAARGRRFLSAGYFLDARQDLEKAEILAWENKDNKMQLFEAQVNMGMVLGKTLKYQDAVSYFTFALDGAGIFALIRDPATLQAFLDARSLAEQLKYYSAFEAYRKAIEGMTEVYAFREVNVKAGESLAGIAKLYGSTVYAIRQKNDLPETMVLKRDTTLLVPFIQ